MAQQLPDTVMGILERFAATPDRLAHTLAGKTPAQLQHKPSPEVWSANEIIAHMRAVDAIVTSRILMILTREDAPLAAFDERQWAEVARYAEREVQDSLYLFTLQRAEIVHLLRHLPQELWQRSGQHETRGSLSILDIVQDMAEHETEHCAQIETLFAP